jgi:ABC-type lipoprotein export system ATPase subunit
MVVSDPLVLARAVSKGYQRGSERVHALRSVTFQVWPGELVAVTGPSGAGKTTLLNLVGGLDQPTSGELRVAGCDLERASEAQRTRLRRAAIGFVFQDFGLVPALSALENVTLPLAFARRLAEASEARALLERVGLGPRLRHRPAELSGGERQRVGIARALVTRPRLLLADEPTGNLDTQAGEQVFRLMRELCREEGLTVILSTHNQALAEQVDRRLRLEDGRLSEETR